MCFARRTSKNLRTKHDHDLITQESYFGPGDVGATYFQGISVARTPADATVFDRLTYDCCFSSVRRSRAGQAGAGPLVPRLDLRARARAQARSTEGFWKGRPTSEVFESPATQ